MSLTKEVVIDRMEILESGQIQVRTATVIKENGVELSRSFYRHVVAPGDDVSKEDKRLQDVAAAVHTPAVVTAFKASAIARENARNPS